MNLSVLNNLFDFLVDHIEEMLDIFFGLSFQLLAKHLSLLQNFDDFFLLKFPWLVGIKEDEKSFCHRLTQLDLVLLAVLVGFVELVNKVNKHVVVQISVLTHFSLQNVDPVLEVLKREVVFKADTVVRHRFPNFFALLQISAYLLAMYETYDRTEEVFHTYSSIFVRLHVEELV